MGFPEFHGILPQDSTLYTEICTIYRGIFQDIHIHHNHTKIFTLSPHTNVTILNILYMETKSSLYTSQKNQFTKDTLPQPRQITIDLGVLLHPY